MSYLAYCFVFFSPGECGKLRSSWGVILWPENQTWDYLKTTQVITVKINKCTQFYKVYNNITKHQPLLVADFTAPS
jgi:uncharacterized CHY-type Zn-finger protein